MKKYNIKFLNLILYFFMEGACVYIDTDNFSTLLMYKEIKPRIVLYLKYNFLEFKVKYISIFDFLNLIPENNIHILSSLPYINDIKLTIDVWRNMALNKLNFLNRFTD
jgi:hypothetical protein